ncbi:MAG: DUF4389 domain-containing protein [Dehalococcoidia bacterium]
MAIALSAADYPVNIEVDPTTEPRNKLTVGFRIILAIPHALLVGGFLSIGAFLSTRNQFGGFLESGVLGTVAFVCAIISWFAILFANQHPEGLRNLGTFYLRWKVRAMAYQALFRDEYPPFGDADYPARLNIELVEFPRDKVSVGLRIIYAIPHILALIVLSIGWFVTSVIAWFAILINGTYPEGLYKFGIGVFRWQTRVEAYLLLLVDKYPPFSLE